MRAEKNFTTSLTLFTKLTLCLPAVLLGSGTLAANLGTPDLDDIEYPDDDPHSEAEISLGKTLFFDTRLSNEKTQSCATCHNPDLGFGDGLQFSLGDVGSPVGRNTPHLYNLAWNSTFFWDGRSTSLEHQALGPIEAAGEMNLDMAIAMERLSAVPYYVEQFQTLYGTSITKEGIGRALAAFERSLNSMNSPFDQYIAGDESAMSPAAVRGLALFQGKANCTECHDGANFTDESFHNIGVDDDDPGRAPIIKDDSLFKAHKTPGLRNTLLTAPYMHNGSEGTLEDVIAFYNRGGDRKEGISNLIKPLGLSIQEQRDLVAFLGALTDPLDIERPTIP